jgi:hypothetical protein
VASRYRRRCESQAPSSLTCPDRPIRRLPTIERDEHPIESACPRQPFVAALVVRKGGRPAWVPSMETAPGVGSTAWPDA